MTVGLFTVLTSTAQNYKFDFRQEKSTKEGYIKVTPTDLFSESKGYGYDLQPVSTSSDTAPFFFSVQIPDGNYRITVLLFYNFHREFVRKRKKELYLRRSILAASHSRILYFPKRDR